MRKITFLILILYFMAIVYAIVHDLQEIVFFFAVAFTITCLCEVVFPKK